MGMRVFIVILLFAASFANAQNVQGIFTRKKPSVLPTEPLLARPAPFQIVRLPVPGNVLPELRNDDVVRMMLAGVAAEFAREFQCDLTVNAGTITVPTIGRVRAAGFTPAQVQAVIEKELVAKNIFTAPKVSLERIAWEPFVTIRGDIRASGRIQWVPGLTLLTAHAATGGPGWNDNETYTITRAGKVTSYSRKHIKADPKLDPKLVPGDVIEVSGEY